MADVTSLAKESVKSLGAGAYLVSVLPSTVTVLVVFALSASSLYPWAGDRLNDKNEMVGDGIPAIVEAAEGLRVAGAVVLVLAVLILSVLLRPFHIAAVQLLEGYWTSRRLAFVTELSLERHRRRRSIGLGGMEKRRGSDRGVLEFRSVAKQLRERGRYDREFVRSARVVNEYPRGQEDLLPTVLGNVLRRAETSAGERYGLPTVLSYPRLYPYLSDKLETQIGTQLRLLDTSAAFVLVLSVSWAASLPLVWRADLWLVLPVAFFLGALVAYRGALRAASLYADLLHTAYDLHRFDMISGLHRPLPKTPEAELEHNGALRDFFANGQSGQELPRLQGDYDHPAPPVLAVSVKSPGSAADGGTDKGTDAGKDEKGPDGDPSAPGPGQADSAPEAKDVHDRDSF